MPIIKHGRGELIPEPEDDKKTASKNWSEEDSKALSEELGDDED